MKENTRWKILAGISLVTLSLLIYTFHYLVFADSHHLFIFLIGDLAFVPIEILIVSLIIDQMLESQEKQRRMEKLNMVIGTFFSTVGTPLVARLAGSDTSLSQIHQRLVIGDGWNSAMFADIKACMRNYTCSIDSSKTDMAGLKEFLVAHEEFMIRLVENPMVFEHESFTDLILAINHLTEEMKARGDLSRLPGADTGHLSNDIRRVYSQLILEWISYMEYLKVHYPYLFSLAMRQNPFDKNASVIVK